ncbi:hypothetical protein LBMAG52_05310 [Planctomycetia bacterium]|nr:hypothetical protein LBMAG52_05310 [Planctomycetia bacterium]
MSGSVSVVGERDRCAANRGVAVATVGAEAVTPEAPVVAAMVVLRRREEVKVLLEVVVTTAKRILVLPKTEPSLARILVLPNLELCLNRHSVPHWW